MAPKEKKTKKARVEVNLELGEEGDAECRIVSTDFCPCMAWREWPNGIPDSHWTCKTHVEFKKWLEKHDSDIKKNLNEVNTKLSNEVSSLKSDVKHLEDERSSDKEKDEMKDEISSLKRKVNHRDQTINRHKSEIRDLWTTIIEDYPKHYREIDALKDENEELRDKEYERKERKKLKRAERAER